MEHDFSYKKRMKKEKTARTEMNEKNRMLKADKHKNIEEIHDVDIQIKRKKKVLPKREQKSRKNSDLCLRRGEFNKTKTEIRNKKMR